MVEAPCLPCRVLLVEDDDDEAALICHQLRGAPDLHVDRADRVSAALSKLTDARADAVLLDLNLPDSSGLDTVARIRAHASEAAVVVLTGASEHEEAGLEALTRGADDYLVKGSLSSKHIIRALRYAIERRRANQRIQRSEHELDMSLSLLKAALESTADGILVVDGKGKIVGTNRRFAELWRIPKGMLAGRDDEAALAFVRDQLKDPESFTRQVQAIYDAPGSESQDSLEFKDGRVFERYSRPQHLRGEVVGRVWSFRDVTARRRLEEQLVITERMATMGTLAAGVGHEINNPLTYVMLGLETLQKKLPYATLEDTAGGRGVKEILTDVYEGAERIRRIVQDLKNFTRVDTIRGPLNVKKMLDFAVSISWNEVKHRARLVKDYGELPAVIGNEGELGQVVLNLIVNAAQSIREGDVDANEIRVVARAQDSARLVIEVRDTGAGIPTETLPRIFEPFFTTKPIGAGTGIGLSICQGIVTKHGGQIAVTSTVGQGSTFRVTLPRGEVDEVRPGEAVAGEAPTRRARVLIIDDEPAICSALAELLAPTHEVVRCSEGRKAVAMVRGGEHFDALLCDLMMPSMSGMDVYKALLVIAPRMADRTVFMSAGAFTPRAQAFLTQVSNPRVEKPFDLRSILAALQEVSG